MSRKLTAEDFRTGRAFLGSGPADLTEYVCHATDPRDGLRHQTHPYTYPTIELVKQELIADGCTDVQIIKVSDLPKR